MNKKILTKTEGKKESGFAIASLILGILSVILGWIPFLGWIFIILAMVFSILALIKIRKGEASGKGMAIAGFVLGSIGLLFAILMTVGFINVTNKPLCKDMNCFITKASQCQPITYSETTEIGKIIYSVETEDTGNCVLTKVIAELSENEDPFIKEALKWKMMKCTYSKGEFNNQWTTSMIEGIEYCDGELKDAIGTLLLLV